MNGSKAPYTPINAPNSFTSNPDFEAVQGDMENSGSLIFNGSDAIHVVTPPIWDSRDLVEYTRVLAGNVSAAARQAGVKRIVYVSSMGAQYDHDIVRMALHDFPISFLFTDFLFVDRGRLPLTTRPRSCSKMPPLRLSLFGAATLWKTGRPRSRLSGIRPSSSRR